jgi:fermentation-respiration switch protein FrsA (DUF1100 family)
MIVGTKDTHCSLAHAQRIKSEIGHAVKSLDTVEGFTHGDFEVGTNTDYVNLVLIALAAPEVPVSLAL